MGEIKSEMTATAVALRLRLTREQVVRRVQKGALCGRLDAERGWLVDRDSVSAYERRNVTETSASIEVA